MVLQWVPREHLLQTVAELDRLCRGFLFIQEFQPGTPATSVSVHNKAVRIFKQDYAAIFRSLPIYALVHEEIHDAEFGDDFRHTQHMLRKLPLESAYRDRKSVQEKDKPVR
jgi:hypothetical protein